MRESKLILLYENVKERFPSIYYWITHILCLPKRCKHKIYFLFMYFFFGLMKRREFIFFNVNTDIYLLYLHFALNKKKILYSIIFCIDGWLVYSFQVLISKLKVYELVVVGT